MSNAEAAQGFVLEIGDPGDIITALTTIAEVTDFAGFDGQRASIDTTHLQSAAKTHMAGVKDCGSWSVSLNYVSADPGQVEARAAFEAGTKKQFLLTFSNGQTANFTGTIFSSPMNGAVDEKMATSFTIQVDGDHTLT